MVESRDGSHFVFKERAGAAPDLVYDDARRDLYVEVVDGGTCDKWYGKTKTRRIHDESGSQGAHSHPDHVKACSLTQLRFRRNAPLRRHFLWAQRKYISNH